jgi:hypothetical protein
LISDPADQTYYSASSHFPEIEMKSWTHMGHGAPVGCPLTEMEKLIEFIRIVCIIVPNPKIQNQIIGIFVS